MNIIKKYLNETKYVYHQVKIHKSSDTLSKNLMGKFNLCLTTPNNM